MLLGDILMIAGVAMTAVGLLLAIIMPIVFKRSKKKLATKIYNEYN